MLKKLISLICILLVVVVAFGVYRTHKSVKNVERYEGIVSQVLKKNGLSRDKELVLAIIYQETRGGQADVMQSSEAVTGQQNTISDSNHSIENGVTHLAQMLDYAAKEKTDVWTGVQAYNFGKAYINYVADHGGKNTLKLADTYSRTVVAPSLGNRSGKTYTHLSLDSIFYNGGKLYVDGGNFFYAREVREKKALIRFFNW